MPLELDVPFDLLEKIRDASIVVVYLKNNKGQTVAPYDCEWSSETINAAPSTLCKKAFASLR